MNKMKVIGITGGVGCGKSEVMSYLEKTYPCVLLSTDEVGRTLMEPDGEAYAPVRALFGDAVVRDDGTFDRAAIARIVFRDEEMLKKLNQIVHPLVKKTVRSAILAAEQRQILYFFLESALLLEEKYNEICMELWYVYAEENVRRNRLKKSRGYSDEKITSMIANQLSESCFRENCQVILDNSGDFAATCASIDARMRELDHL